MKQNNVQKLFSHFDKNKDGQMQMSELEVLFQVLKEVQPNINVNQGVVQDYMMKADKNGDNQLSYRELVSFMSILFYPNDPTRENMQKQFYSFDMDVNGLMNKAEFHNFMKSVYHYMNDPRFKYRDSVADAFFGDLDQNQDGNISFDEFYLYINGALYY
ncbi:MAG: hypothetical protein GY938_03020 [Ketobacter sp.]|nr:hypothetical protein [Ketobacter sp.]